VGVRRSDEIREPAEDYGYVFFYGKGNGN